MVSFSMGETRCTGYRGLKGWAELENSEKIETNNKLIAKSDIST
jgi:hypothetical protein